MWCKHTALPPPALDESVDVLSPGGSQGDTPGTVMSELAPAAGWCGVESEPRIAPCCPTGEKQRGAWYPGEGEVVPFSGYIGTAAVLAHPDPRDDDVAVTTLSTAGGRPLALPSEVLDGRVVGPPEARGAEETMDVAALGGAALEHIVVCLDARHCDGVSGAPFNCLPTFREDRTVFPSPPVTPSSSFSDLDRAASGALERAASDWFPHPKAVSYAAVTSSFTETLAGMGGMPVLLPLFLSSSQSQDQQQALEGDPGTALLRRMGLVPEYAAGLSPASYTRFLDCIPALLGADPLVAPNEHSRRVALPTAMDGRQLAEVVRAVRRGMPPQALMDQTAPAALAGLAGALRPCWLARALLLGDLGFWRRAPFETQMAAATELSRALAGAPMAEAAALGGQYLLAQAGAVYSPQAAVGGTLVDPDWEPLSAEHCAAMRREIVGTVRMGLAQQAKPKLETALTSQLLAFILKLSAMAPEAVPKEGSLEMGDEAMSGTVAMLDELLPLLEGKMSVEAESLAGGLGAGACWLALLRARHCAVPRVLCAQLRHCCGGLMRSWAEDLAAGCSRLCPAFTASRENEWPSEDCFEDAALTLAPPNALQACWEVLAEAQKEVRSLMGTPVEMAVGGAALWQRLQQLAVTPGPWCTYPEEEQADVAPSSPGADAGAYETAVPGEGWRWELDLACQNHGYRRRRFLLRYHDPASDLQQEEEAQAAPTLQEALQIVRGGVVMLATDELRQEGGEGEEGDDGLVEEEAALAGSEGGEQVAEARAGPEAVCNGGSGGASDTPATSGARSDTGTAQAVEYVIQQLVAEAVAVVKAELDVSARDAAPCGGLEPLDPEELAGALQLNGRQALGALTEPTRPEQASSVEMVSIPNSIVSLHDLGLEVPMPVADAERALNSVEAAVEDPEFLREVAAVQEKGALWPRRSWAAMQALHSAGQAHRAEMVSPREVTTGLLLLLPDAIYFQPASPSGEIDVAPRQWPVAQVCDMQLRRRYMQRCALELFLCSGDSVLLRFPEDPAEAGVAEGASCTVRKLHAWILERSPPQLDLGLHRNGLPAPRQLPARAGWTEAWSAGKMTNLEYLMRLNAAAGRSLQDLSQYPVMPWVLVDYAFPDLDLEEPASFRDLTLPVGALREEPSCTKPRQRSEGHGADAGAGLFWAHYSTPRGVADLLAGARPFRPDADASQRGPQASPSLSVRKLWEGASSNPLDHRELVPEWFYCPEALAGRELPPWAAGSAEEFVRLNLAALESSHVSAHLHHWIDLIFGCKQRGPAAAAAHNTFFCSAYEGALDLLKVASAERTRQCLDTTGQCPMQLFSKSHPPRAASATTSLTPEPVAPMPGSGPPG
ncbi:hypothetical protein CYMTET_51703 [Cymbomonas tetramitiformis]|uniref:BEACH domain-containing protein n=1 Tax=Cymbomonas tetramitiformis TaxID=36881 RepID=A0AAE0BME0_9CHLO|nr:hypothetical protein CYMTET_51703 [Cymbomonas tetramitiformis]